MSDQQANPPTSLTIPPEMQELMAAVGATLATAQALERTMVALVLLLDGKHQLGAPVEQLKEDYGALLRDPLGALITKLGQVTGASNDDLRQLRDIKNRRDAFVHGFCVSPTFVIQAKSSDGRKALLKELLDLTATLETTRLQAGHYALRAAERFGVTPEAALSDLKELIEGRASRVLDADVVRALREPGTLESAQAILNQLATIA